MSKLDATERIENLIKSAKLDIQTGYEVDYNSGYQNAMLQVLIILSQEWEEES